MTLRDRVESFKAAFPKTPASWPWLVQEDRRDCLYAVWVIGNDYRGTSKFYGQYPPSYLRRVLALFPDVPENRILHAFSGSLSSGKYERCDLIQPAEYQCRVEDLPEYFKDERRGLGAARHYPQLVLADPPYSARDAERYGTSGVNRSKAVKALGDLVGSGGHLAWLDTCWPIHNKKQWLTVGRIFVQRSTNHRARVLSLFERQ